MSVGPTAATPPRHVSPVRKAFHRHHICRPISQHHAFAAASPHIDGPSSSTSSASPIISTTKTHLANLDRVLLTKQPSPPPPPPPLLFEDYPQSGRPSRLNLLSLPSALFPSPEEISPHSIGHLHHLLSNSSRPSPRGPIASRWRQFHGTNNWEGLLDPLDDDLRRELVRYGDLIQATYQAFGSEAPGVASIPSLPDQSYRVTRHLFATASVELPSWFATVAPWTKVTPRTSWIGYVAVCDNEREIRRMGRRDIVVALRGTATCLEWAENFRTGLVPIDDDGGDHSAKKHRANAPKVECGFRSLYKTPGHDTPSLSSAVVEELRRLTEQYAGEEVSVTLTGHSLGAALAVLAADEVAALGVPTAVFSFGGPRVGNRAFAERVEARGAKVLRVVNARDLVTRVPGMLPLPAAGGGGYAHVGRELLVDSRKSPYLRPDADPACCHDLEAYLHLVDGFMATDGPFRADAKRGLARLLRHQGGNVKQVYVSVARALRSQGAPTFCSCSQSAFEPVHRKRGSAMSDPYRYQKSLQLKGAEQLSRTWRTRNSSSSIVDRPI